MSGSTIYRAANDLDLAHRVTALAYKELQTDTTLADTSFGKQMLSGYANMLPLMYSVAVATEADYEAAITAGNGSPGHDETVISDADITAAIVAGWPPDTVPTPTMAPGKAV